LAFAFGNCYIAGNPAAIVPAGKWSLFFRLPRLGNLVTDNFSSQDCSTAHNRSEFFKWLDIVYRLVDSAPTTWGTWQQTRDFQELLADLARKLGFEHGPIERRNEEFTVNTAAGRELHHREYVVATEPSGPSVAERFDGWIKYPVAIPFTIRGVRGGMAEIEFREEVLVRLVVWRKAVEART
jgi:hypothetical protein